MTKFCLFIVLSFFSLQASSNVLSPIAHKFVETVFQEEQLVLKNQKEWHDFWRRFSVSETPTLTDFSMNDVVIFLMGAKGTGGFSVRIESVIVEKENTVINVLKCVPKKGEPQVAEVTSPYAMKIVPKISRKIKWQKRQKVTGTKACI